MIVREYRRKGKGKRGEGEGGRERENGWTKRIKHFLSLAISARKIMK